MLAGVKAKYNVPYKYIQIAEVNVKKSEQTKAELLASSGKAFGKEGYAGIGVLSIAKAAGVTSGAFYAHLKSKNDAFRAALVAGLEEVLVALPQYRETQGTEWRLLRTTSWEVITGMIWNGAVR